MTVRGLSPLDQGESSVATSTASTGPDGVDWGKTHYPFLGSEAPRHHPHGVPRSPLCTLVGSDDAVDDRSAQRAVIHRQCGAWIKPSQCGRPDRIEALDETARREVDGLRVPRAASTLQTSCEIHDLLFQLPDR